MFFDLLSKEVSFNVQDMLMTILCVHVYVYICVTENVSQCKAVNNLVKNWANSEWQRNTESLWINKMWWNKLAVKLLALHIEHGAWKKKRRFGEKQVRAGKS